jgi:hypothetical protein
MPFADLSLPENVAAWFVLRQVVQNFGYEFVARLNKNTAYFFVSAFFTVVLFGIQIFEAGGQIIVGELSNRANLESITLFLVAFELLSLVLFFLAMLVVYGTTANSFVWIHRGILNRVQLNLREKRMNAARDFRLRTRNGQQTVTSFTRVLLFHFSNPYIS